MQVWVVCRVFRYGVSLYFSDALMNAARFSVHLLEIHIYFLWKSLSKSISHFLLSPVLIIDF